MSERERATAAWTDRYRKIEKDQQSEEIEERQIGTDKENKILVQTETRKTDKRENKTTTIFRRGHHGEGMGGVIKSSLLWDTRRPNWEGKRLSSPSHLLVLNSEVKRDYSK